MKKLLIALLLLTSCQKDEIDNVPAGITGAYLGTLTTPTNTYSRVWSVNKLDNFTIEAVESTSFGPYNTIYIKCAGKDLTVEPQAYHWPTGGGGVVSGSGYFSGNTIILTLAWSYSGNNTRLDYLMVM